MVPNRVLKAYIRAFTALERVTRRIVPYLLFGVAVEITTRTARMVCSALRRLDFPHPASYPIGPVHLDHVFILAGQFACECGAEWSCGLDSDRGETAIAAHS